MNEIKLAYSDLYNAGDLMNVDIVEKLSGKKVLRSKTYCANMTAIGGAIYGLQYSDGLSKKLCQYVLHLIYGKKPIYIWGSGFWHNYNKNKLFHDNLQVCALRGAKSQQKLKELTGIFYDVPLADGGLLIDMLIDVPNEKKYKIGLIPHMSQQEEKAMKEFAAREDVHIIDIKRTPQEVGRDIALCETIVSSSLHGLIFADALHIPNIHIKGKKDLPEGNFKFEDYYSSYGLEDDWIDLEQHIPTYEEIISRYKVDWNEVDKKKQQLLECFPKF